MSLKATIAPEPAHRRRLFWAWMGAAFLLCSARLYADQSAGSPAFDDLSKQAFAALSTDPAQAAKLYGQALALRPDWTEGWFYLGASRFQTKNYSESEAAFKNAANLSPDNGTVWGFRALTQEQLGRDAEAFASARKGEALGLPEDIRFTASVRNAAARICLRHRDFGDALEQLRPLAVADESSPETIQNFGMAALAMNFPNGTIPPEKVPVIALAGQAVWAFSASRHEVASKLMEQLETKYPKEPSVHYVVGIYLLDQDSAAATVEFEKELQVNPGNTNAQSQIAVLDLKDGKTDAAIALLQSVLKTEPTSSLALISLGRAYLKNGKIKAAEEELEKAERVAPNDPQVRFYLEQAYRRDGRTTDAQREHAAFTRLKKEKDPGAAPPDS